MPDEDVSAEAIRLQPWCSECGNTTQLQTEYLIPIAAGGKTDVSNVDVICERCQQA